MPQPKKNILFETGHLKDGLKKRSIRGGMVTFSSQGTLFVLNLISTAILARLLDPQDFGLVAMVSAITGFVAMFKDMGLSMATVQRKEVTHEQISSLFWVNVGLSFLIFLIILAISPGIAWFYDDPRLTKITVLSATGILIGGLSLQHQALLNRQMRFASLAGIQIISRIIGIIAGVCFALYGFGYWALVFMPLVSVLTGTLVSWGLCRWLPSRPRWDSSIKPFLKFGGNLTGFNTLNYFARNADNVLLGWKWGASELGFYSKAYSLLMFPIKQINAPLAAVAIPALSRLQDDKEKFEAYYCKSLSIVSNLTAPLIIFLAAFSDELVLFILGPNWAQSAVIFKVLAFAGLGQSSTSTCGWVFTSLGQTDRMFRWGIISSTLITLSFVIGLYWKSIGIAISYAIITHALRVPAFYYTHRYSPVSFKKALLITYKPIAMALVAYSLITLFKDYGTVESGFGKIVISSILGLSPYVVLILILWRNDSNLISRTFFNLKDFFAKN